MKHSFTNDGVVVAFAWPMLNMLES